MKELQELKQRVNELELICKVLLAKKNKPKFDLFKELYSEGVYTQREIAKTIGVSYATIKRYKNKLN